MKVCFSLIISLLFIANPAFATNKHIDSLLLVLDKTIECKHIYSEIKEKRIDSLKGILENQSLSIHDKIPIIKNLCSEYNVYCTDSALQYSTLLTQYTRLIDDNDEYIDSEFLRTRIYKTMGLLKESYEVIAEIDTSGLSQRLKNSYVYTKLSVYNALRDFSRNDKDKIEYENLAKPLRYILLKDKNLQLMNRIYVKAEQQIADKQYDKALAELLDVYGKMESEKREAGIIAYSIAIIYNAKGEKDKELEFFTLSAIADLKNGIKAYTSLRRLASLMFEYGDIDRAYDYMKCSMEDAIFCNARLRTLEASEMFLIIDKSYQKKLERSRRTIIIFLMVTLCLVISLLLAITYIRKQNRQLSITKDKLSLSNYSLKETNKILSNANIVKEEYIGLYIEHYSDYLSRVDDYKKKAQRIAKLKGEQALLQFIESSLNPKDDLEQFYKDFDSTILRLFPRFVSQFNSLLLEGESIIPKCNDSLTPELRIFALIRLGITDSIKIAHFLRYSTSTIYNYRTKIRNKAAGNRDEFEGKVMKIDISSPL